jgi:hypothetical protein
MKTPPGQSAEEGGVWLAGLLKNVFTAVMLIFFVGITLLPDIYLGPQFMFSYIDTQGKVDPTAISPAIPWCLSAATSGMQYLIYRRISKKPEASNDRLALIVAVILALVDTAIDVGGFTAMFYGPEVGMQIVPDNPSVGWYIGGFFVLALCLGHEYLLIKFLVDKSDQAKERATGTACAWIVDGVVWVLELIFGTTRGLFVVASVFAIAALDFWLGPEFLFTITENDPVSFVVWPLWLVPIGISAITTGILYFFHRKLRDTGTKTGPLFKLLVLAFVICDTWLDLAGFTAFMHGPDEITLMPEDAGIAWILLLFLVGGLCALGEWLCATLLGGPAVQMPQIRRRKNRGMPEPSMGGMPGGGMAAGYE